jgi:L-alanine-DL-glutamate epimerase-like enolase superfamily enzyme
MAHEAGMLCTPHMSGSGLGYLDAAMFASLIPNPVPFTEYKGSADVPISSETSSLKVEKGMVRLPSGPGFGVTIDPAFVRGAVRVTAS